MATQVTPSIDETALKSRRKAMQLGVAGLASVALGASSTAYAQSTAPTVIVDNDILNVALNLEYLSAYFFFYGAFGIDLTQRGYYTGLVGITGVSSSQATPVYLNSPVLPTGTKGVNYYGTPGATVGGTFDTATGGTAKGPASTTQQIISYAVETAVGDARHIETIQGYLAQVQTSAPNINIAGYQASATNPAFVAMAKNAGLSNASTFNPYNNETSFLLAAYFIKEILLDFYIGAVSMMTVPATLAYLNGILAAEAYQAGALRTIINSIDPTGTGIAASTKLLSAYRAKLALAASPVTLGQSTTVSPYDPSPDDVGVGTQTGSLGGGTTVNASTIVNANPANFVAFARTITQTLNVVTFGGAVAATTPPTAITPAVGGFFPTGINAGPNGFR